MNLLTIKDMPEDVMKEVISKAIELKKEGNRSRKDLEGKVLISLYEKPSTRTRLSFETAMYNLGGRSIVMDFKSSQMSRGEAMSDTARVLSRYGNIISARLFKQETLDEIAKHASVPVINALTDAEHPCQALADMQTIIEHGKEKGKLVYIGEAANNVANSIMLTAAKYGMHVVLCCPEHFPPRDEYLEAAKSTGATVEVIHDPKKAVENADVIYTDVWISMGMEGQEDERMKYFKPYQVNKELVSHAKSDCIILHCLPAHRGIEITDDVLDGDNAKSVWDQAENRMWAQEALILKLLKE